MVRTEWTTVAHHVFEVYGVRVARDSADPKRTGVRIVVVLKLLDSMAKPMGKELSKVQVKSISSIDRAFTFARLYLTWLQ